MELDLDKPASTAKAEEAGAPGPIPEITPEMLPEAALMEAAGRLSTSLEAGVPLADYAEAACLLFSELIDRGWTIVPSASNTRTADNPAIARSPSRSRVWGGKASRHNRRRSRNRPGLASEPIKKFRVRGAAPPFA